MIVHVVYTEYQNGDPAIVGIYRDLKDAEAARDREIATQETELHNAVYGHVPPGIDPDTFDEAAWDVDVHLEAVEVQ